MGTQQQSNGFRCLSSLISTQVVIRNAVITSSAPFVSITIGIGLPLVLNETRGLAPFLAYILVFNSTISTIDLLFAASLVSEGLHKMVVFEHDDKGGIVVVVDS